MARMKEITIKVINNEAEIMIVPKLNCSRGKLDIIVEGLKVGEACSYESAFIKLKSLEQSWREQFIGEPK